MKRMLKAKIHDGVSMILTVPTRALQYNSPTSKRFTARIKNSSCRNYFAATGGTASGT